MKTFDCKGQIFLTDLVLASIVFLFILTLSIVYSAQVADRVGLLEEDSARQLAVQSAANALLLSPGSPANWENLEGLNNVSSIGLAGNRNEIHPAKLQRFMDLNAGNYNSVRDLLGLPKYGLKVSVLRLGNRESLAEFGLEPGSEERVTAVNRIAFYDGEEVIVRVKVFEE